MTQRPRLLELVEEIALTVFCVVMSCAATFACVVVLWELWRMVTR